MDGLSGKIPVKWMVYHQPWMICKVRDLPPCLVELNLANNDIRDAGSLVDDVPTEAHIWCIW